MSNDLKEFYRAYKAWIDDGADLNHYLFKRRFGLCSNLLNFYHHGDRANEALREMYSQFEDAGLSVDYPFDGCESKYFAAGLIKESHHANPARVKWVEEHAK